jgi:hypothetical protein
MPKKTIDLKYPIDVGGASVSTLTLRRPKVGDIERTDKADGPVGKSVILLSDLAELTPEEVRSIDAADYGQVMRELEGFLGFAL